MREIGAVSGWQITASAAITGRIYRAFSHRQTRFFGVAVSCLFVGISCLLAPVRVTPLSGRIFDCERGEF